MKRPYNEGSMYDLYAGDLYVGNIIADEIRTIQEHRGPYCSVFGTVFYLGDKRVATVWSDGLSWRIA